MSRSIPIYSKLYSISDLHLGGSVPANQMFCKGTRLQSFIQSLSSRRDANAAPIALVLAGDIIDSLPFLTLPGSYIAVDGAANIVRTVMDNASFKPVFDGLKDYIQQDGCELIILIGNHDLELSFPEAQEELLNEITTTPSARGRVRFFMQGTGFRCTVGSRNVYITHGNEADPWNHVDYDALRQASHARTLGKPFNPEKWVPNAGTKLVVDVMNEIKRNHPFIDLLKPEVGAAVKVLSALDRNAVEYFYKAIPAFAKAAKAQVGPHVVLGADGQLTASDPEVVRLLGDAFPGPSPNKNSSNGDLMSKVAEYPRDKRPEDLVSDSDGTLGYFGYWWDKKMGKSNVEALREALKDWVNGDQSFKFGHPDSTLKGVLSQLGRGIDVVITGHTHLPRWIHAVDRGNVTYLNSGTWARLMGLRHEVFENEETFKPVYDALQATDLAVLDKIKINGCDLILNATLAACVTDKFVGLVRINDEGQHPIEIDPKNPNFSLLDLDLT
jgi:UDP-2,3-diacylglucosamine pyrophosphatase LpxH